MSKKCQHKIYKIRYFAVVFMLAILGLFGLFGPAKNAAAINLDSCPKLRIVFARGSGGVRWEDNNYLDFRDTIKAKLAQSGWSAEDYEFIDLDYPAIGINLDNFWEVLGAYFGAGDSYQFGKSVDAGVENLVSMANETCKDTKYVLGGYSQGAMVVSKAIHSITADKIVYAATFGDPKLYLPEGRAFGSIPIFSPSNGSQKNLLRTGAIPAACKGENLSDYRMYVPDCYAYEGMLGAYKPYQPLGYSGKLGTWCNGHDIFCSSGLNVTDHLKYYNASNENDLYQDASKVIAAKINEAFGVKNQYVSTHDTAILIDSTGSMDDLIDQYKEEALNLARKTLENGGRVALYDYRDVRDDYEPQERCNFETCTLETFKKGLSEIETDKGGDEPESLLSASFKVMKKLNWSYGATKSVVVLTDASYHSPDLDRVTFADVVALSKSIDPVNFYIITPEKVMAKYQELAAATDGAVVASTSDLSILTRTIIERYDSLPRVEEDSVLGTVPEISSASFTVISADRARISWSGDMTRTLVVLNDAILGVTESSEIVIGDLDFSAQNIVRLVPMSDERKGDSIELELTNTVVIPGAPNTGKGC